jgi:hypothetical protein
LCGDIGVGGEEAIVLLGCANSDSNSFAAERTYDHTRLLKGLRKGVCASANREPDEVALRVGEFADRKFKRRIAAGG